MMREKRKEKKRKIKTPLCLGFGKTFVCLIKALFHRPLCSFPSSLSFFVLSFPLSLLPGLALVPLLVQRLSTPRAVRPRSVGSAGARKESYRLESMAGPAAGWEASGQGVVDFGNTMPLAGAALTHCAAANAWVVGFPGGLAAFADTATLPLCCTFFHAPRIPSRSLALFFFFVFSLLLLLVLSLPSLFSLFLSSPLSLLLPDFLFLSVFVAWVI